jgi:hypothetical protein
MQPDARYARSGGINIACQLLREGPRDPVFVPGARIAVTPPVAVAR